MSARPSSEQEVISQLPAGLQRWLTLECFHLHKPELFQDRSRDLEFDTKYFPQNCGAFELPCFWVRRKFLQMYGRHVPDGNELSPFADDGRNERVLFPIHPSSLKNYAEFLAKVAAEDAAHEGLHVWAVPTSSTRTLLAWPDQAPEKALFVKTTLHSPIFGDRHLYPKIVARGIGLSRFVQESQANLPAELGYLPEPLGFVPRQLPDSGVVIRSIPQEIKEGRVLVAPLFSLMGGSGSHVPLFLTLLERNGMQPRQLLEEVLCAPVARLWLQMSLDFGLVLEAHGQDLLLALSPDLTPLGRFFYRDFEGVQVDWELRYRRGFPVPQNLPHAWRWRETYGTWGYTYGECVWYKWQMSLLHYMHLVLNELEGSLRKWHERGLIPGPGFEEGEVTLMFSRHLMQATGELFGVRPQAEYNVYRQLKRFLILLMQLRRDILR